MKQLQAFCSRWTTSPRFQHAVTALIVLNAIILGLETSPDLLARWGRPLHALNLVLQALFVTEILMRVLAERRVLSFFKDGWNTFDFVVVGLSLLPAVGPLATVARLARVLRVLRLVSTSEELRLIIATMIRSIPSMGHISLLLGILIYTYAILGVHWFGQLDPIHWGTLGRSALTLFEIMTLEGWVEIQDTVLSAQPVAWVFFLSYIVIAVFVVVNLFIAVVLNNLESVKSQVEEARLSGSKAELHAELADIQKRLQSIQTRLKGCS